MSENKWIDRHLSEVQETTDETSPKTGDQEETTVPDEAAVDAAFKREADDFPDLEPSTSDDDRKPPARQESRHPLDADDVDDFARGRLDTQLFELARVDGPPCKRARNYHGSSASMPSYDYTHHFPMPNFPYASPVGHPGSFQPGATFDYQPSPFASMPPAHGHTTMYTNHPYPQMEQQPMAQFAHPGSHPGYEPPSPIQPSQPTTATGENSREFPFRGPSPTELHEARTARARSALHTWYQRLEDLWKYKQENGHCNVPQKYDRNRELGIWVNKQRMEKKAFDEQRKTSMTPRKIESLNRVGFQWAKRKGQAAWDEKFEELVEYKSIHGNCDVPTKYTENPALGRWVSTQRSNYKEREENGDTSKMTDERKARLDSVGFKWRMMN